MNKSDKNYTREINKVIDHIHTHLSDPLTVEELAGLVNLSLYHFHRIFSATVGEPLAKYVLRKRLEKAAALLLSDTDSPIMNIADDCGFNSMNVFCRNFKRHFGTTANTHRNKNRQANSKNRPLVSINNPHVRTYTRYFCNHKTIITGGKEMNCTFEIKNLPAINIIYCRHHGAFNQMQDTFARLMQWAYPRGLVNTPAMKLLSVYHDHPDITATDKLTADAGMIVEHPLKTDGDIGQYQIDEGLYAVGRFEIGMEEFPAAWRATFGLITEHGCQCTNGHHYEVYQSNPDQHPEKKWVVDICIPVRPL